MKYFSIQMRFGLHGNIKIDVNSQKIDSLALSANKFYGPKGIGALYIRKGIKFRRLLFGGHQERNKRPGTENVPEIVGLGKAIEIAYEEFDKNINKILELRNYFIEEVTKRIQDITINGDMEKRLPENVNISFNDVEAETLIKKLAAKGIATSNGNNYTSGLLEPSHVLLALQIPYEIANSTIAITIGKYNTKEEIDYTLKTLEEIIPELRKKSVENKKIETCRFSRKCSGNCASCHK